MATSSLLLPPSAIRNGGLPLTFALNMVLTREEIQRAHSIKAAVEADEHLKNLSDFEYVQWALCHPLMETPQLTTIVGHIRRMQSFSELYDIKDSVEEGVQAVDELTVALQPGALLVTQYLPGIGVCVAVDDFASFVPANIQTPEQHAQLIRGIYYRLQSLHPNFFATRKGSMHIMECQGATWANFDVHYHQRLVDELLYSYPKRELDVYFINAPTVVNIMFGLWKRFMSPKFKASIHLDEQIPGMNEYGTRLSDLYQVPNAEIARQRMISDIRELLQVRYQHQATYRLPPLNENPLQTRINLEVALRQAAAHHGVSG